MIKYIVHNFSDITVSFDGIKYKIPFIALETSPEMFGVCGRYDLLNSGQKIIDYIREHIEPVIEEMQAYIFYKKHIDNYGA